ncbi:MAG TPA: hypothetical protein VEL10_07925 [Gaiellaceae bacterium]|nr:hypothetical protein [Gaiellaceae bacterium]
MLLAGLRPGRMGAPCPWRGTTTAETEVAAVTIAATMITRAITEGWSNGTCP